MSSQLPWEALGAPVAGTQYGLNLPKPRIARFKTRVGSVAVGDVLQIDVANTDTTSTAWDNTTAGITSNLIAPRAGLIANIEAGMAVVVTDLLGGAGADNTDVLACYYGPVSAFVIDAGGTVAFGEQLTITTAKNFDGVKASGERVFGVCLEADSTTTSRGLLRVFLTNGYAGITAAVGGATAGSGIIPT